MNMVIEVKGARPDENLSEAVIERFYAVLEDGTLEEALCAAVKRDREERSPAVTANRIGVGARA
jgi:hypothetical protein